MDGFGTKAESDLLQQLFRENNEIRARFNALSRELYDKSTLYEDAEEEIRELKQKLEQRNVNVDNKTRPGTSTLDKSSKRPQSSTTSHSNPGIASLSKQLEEALLILDRRNNELQQLQSELDNSKATILQYQSGAEQSEREIRDLEEQVAQLRREQGELIMLHSNGSADSEDEEESTQDDAMTPSRKSKRPKQSTDTEDTSAVVTNLKKQLVESEETVRSLRKQVVEVATDANMRHNELQGELQGMEALIDSVRSDYAAFINTTRLEHETYKATQAAQYASLKSQLEAHRASDFAERKRLTKEYEGVLYSMQAEFEEYRAMSEFLFNAEVAKLEEELTSQASRYEQEILYVIQAKDKFYADMMVAKDAKIMNLIEGSDLQTLMQKHEVDMENLRRDHIRELERLKSDQESEAKSLIQLLQRQNSSLENKCEKLQAHIKVLESRIKESQSLLDARAKNYAEKEDSWVKREKDYEGKISEMLERNATLVREKEHLRHKVIRLNLDAKGEAGNGIDSMLKRISRDTIDLQNQYTELSIKYEDVSNDLQSSSKRLKEKDRFILYLEKEVSRRNEDSAGSAKSGTGGMAYGDMDKKQSEIEETERMELERGFA
ncbi:hypothetical protein M427DRAFT_66609 [Gonapodya prolifera JEL478]|uniref:Uncharacterized protein n=1 Tax=Gonapodya prolifera (strain JEL478) TaxID=1344416 RepID=A0A139AVF5_GONPJ|nr:hypothetical protein M427DRAFT_66609 [Gonapodya prolifera JEL478]|eukprot:KXS20679.1 hypothetical protein M427DRAFT_66609 [Gonapodya prolifera JEL478]